MIYTVGHRENYRQAQRFCLEQGLLFAKKGTDLTEGYPGGSVWQTRPEAEAYLRELGLADFDVFGVEADWDQDTAPSGPPGHGPRRLLRDSPLVVLEGQS